QEGPIRTILNRYVDLLGSQLGEMKELYGALAEPERFVDADGAAELQGMADGLGMPVDYLLALNLGAFPPGCVQFAVTSRRNGSEGLIHATNEDSALSLALANCLARMVQVRRPARGIPHVIFSTVGYLGGINGINASGVTVTSTTLLD